MTDSAEQNQPVRRTHSKGRAALFILFSIILLAVATCFGLILIRSYIDSSPAPVDPAELPQIQTSVKHVKMCPNGKVFNFDFKVTDNKDGDITKQAEIKPALGGAIIKVADADGHQASRFVPAEISDTTAPVINLNGDQTYSVLVDHDFTAPAATATDNCDGEIAVETSGDYDTTTTGEYIIKYTATDSSSNTTTAQRVINVTTNTGVIYLTFDDGPGPYTEELLDILEKYNVKATFFVTGRGDNDVLKREYDEGHAIGLHSFSHDYADIYRSTDTYFADLDLIQQRVKDVTGQESHLLRFPGGSSNTVSSKYDGGSHLMSTLVDEVKDKGFTYFDWNISSGDAGGATSADEVYNIVTSRLAPDKDWIILQHDIKGFSVDAVERIIEYGKDHGYTFKKLDENSFTAAHGVLN